MFDGIIDAISDGIDGLLQTIGDYFLYNFIYKIFYYLEIALCFVLSWLEQIYRVFTGMDDVTYEGSSMPLFNVFFQNKGVSGVFWGMAALGIVFAFASAIVQMTRKSLDIDDKVKMPIGQILTNLFRSIVIILTMNVAVTIVAAFVDQIMEAVNFTFDNAYNMTGPTYIEFSDEENAAMGRIFNTIGNYSLNPSYKNRYSINACYNEIRSDLMYLAGRNVFKFHYETLDEDGNIIPTWQSVIARIANAADYTKEHPVDVYNEGIANAISDAMDIIRSDATLEHLEDYNRIVYLNEDNVGFDRIVFVTATMGFGRTAGAKNNEYNVRPAMNDALREPYYRGIKDIYDIDQVNEDFDISIFKTNYLVAYGLTILLAFNMGLIILTAVARIFNMIFLYVISPPIIGLMPLDDGQKFHQWLTAFIVQTFSIFALVISMRLYLIFVPIILSPALQLADNVLIDMIGKILLIYGGMEAVGKANGILTGILADQAGMQSIQAGDMKSSLGKFGAAVAAIGSSAWGVGKSAISNGVDVAKSSVGGFANSISGALGGGGSDSQGTALPDKSGVAGALPDNSGGGAGGGGASGLAGGAGGGIASGLAGGGGEAATVPAGGGGSDLPDNNARTAAMSRSAQSAGGSQTAAAAGSSGGSRFSDEQFKNVFGTDRNAAAGGQEAGTPGSMTGAATGGGSTATGAGSPATGAGSGSGQSVSVSSTGGSQPQAKTPPAMRSAAGVGTAAAAGMSGMAAGAGSAASFAANSSANSAASKAESVLRDIPGKSIEGMERAGSMAADAVEGAGSFIADSFRFVAGDDFPKGAGAAGGASSVHALSEEDDGDGNDIPIPDMFSGSTGGDSSVQAGSAAGDSSSSAGSTSGGFASSGSTMGGGATSGSGIPGSAARSGAAAGNAASSVAGSATGNVSGVTRASSGSGPGAAAGNSTGASAGGGASSMPESQRTQSETGQAGAGMGSGQTAATGNSVDTSGASMGDTRGVPINSTGASSGLGAGEQAAGSEAAVPESQRAQSETGHTEAAGETVGTSDVSSATESTSAAGESTYAAGSTGSSSGYSESANADSSSGASAGSSSGASAGSSSGVSAGSSSGASAGSSSTSSARSRGAAVPGSQRAYSGMGQNYSGMTGSTGDSAEASDPGASYDPLPAQQRQIMPEDEGLADISTEHSINDVE